VAHNFEGKYLDCGTMKGYINSSKVIGKLWNYVWSVQVM
jgi:UTP--glucose-1-phosphate uridylyltransferase